MKRNLSFMFLGLGVILCGLSLNAATKQHIVNFGKSMTVKLFVGTDETKSVELKVNPLYVDGKLKEFTTGETHVVTERLFVVQRAYRVNDALPEDNKTVPKWKWQRGGWLLVDKTTGRVSQLSLPEFDPFYSTASWYREYIAYCGVSDSGEKFYAVVAQIGSRKAILRKDLGRMSGGDMPDSLCRAPEWQRQPVRVTFLPKDAQKLTFAIKGRAADLAAEPEPNRSEE